MDASREDSSRGVDADAVLACWVPGLWLVDGAELCDVCFHNHQQIEINRSQIKMRRRLATAYRSLAAPRAPRAPLGPPRGAVRASCWTFPGSSGSLKRNIERDFAIDRASRPLGRGTFGVVRLARMRKIRNTPAAVGSRRVAGDDAGELEMGDVVAVKT